MRSLFKKALSAVVALSLFSASSELFGKTGNTDSVKDDPLVLKSLWTKYEKAVSSDLPVRAADILQDIISESEKKHLSWDFYHAWDLYVTNRESRNWKESEKYRKMMSEGISEYGDPFLVFFHDAGKWTVGADSLWSYVYSRKESLLSSRNGGFYGRRGRIFNQYVPDALAENITDDYEYSLWVLLSRYDLGRELRKKIYGELEACVSDSYPLSAVLEFNGILSLPEKEQKDSMEAFAGKYDGKAAALLAEQLLMHGEFNEMEGNAGSGDYSAFREKCSGFEKRRASFKGCETLIADNCTIVKSLADLMDSESLVCHVDSGTVTLLTRNLKKVMVSAGRGEDILYEGTVVNAKGSYYVCDTLKLRLPDFDDGEYWVECRSAKTEYSRLPYEKYTLSVAVRTTKEGTAIYVADYLTGKPVEKADVELLKKGEVVSVAENMSFPGFAMLPENLMKMMEENPSDRFYLRCSTTDANGRIRKSRELAVWNMYSQSAGTESGMRAELLLDRKLYAPGDTVFFKGIVSGFSGKENTGCVGKLPVKVMLRDAERNEVASCNLVTNSFGSVSGKFIVPENRRNGYFSLILESDGKVAGMASFRVEDLVLPSFGVAFDEGNDVILAGDTVTVSGKLFSYSGHGMESARISYVVTAYDSVREGVLQVGNDGRFELKFRAEQEVSGYVGNVRIKVTDATGETQEFSRTVYVTDMLHMNVDVHNEIADASVVREAVRGKLQPGLSRGVSVVSSDTVDLTFILDLYGRDMDYALPVSYKLMKDGKILSADRTVTGKRISIDLGTEKSGKYVIEAVVNGKDGYGKELSDTLEYEMLKLKDDAEFLDFHVDNIFKVVDNGNISLQFGSTSGPVWAVADIYGPGKALLNSEMISIGGTSSGNGSLMNIEYEWRPEWGNEAVLQVFYFRNGKSYEYSHRYTRNSEVRRMPLKIVSFEDRALPDTEYSVIIRGGAETECLAAVFDISTERIMPNRWDVPVRDGVSVENVRISRAEGSDGTGRYGLMNSARLGKAVASAYVADTAADSAVMEEEVSGSGLSDVDIRENFSRTLAFEPFIEADDDGMMSFRFRTSDALSTYCIQLFAHDRDMNCAVAREEMLVTLPLKVSLLPPAFLYGGDKYFLRATVSSNADEMIKGRLVMSVYEGDRHDKTLPAEEESVHVEIPASGSGEYDFGIDVADTFVQNGKIGIRLVFISDDGAFSDGLFVTVPVYPAAQTLMESHSSVLLPGMSEDSLLTELRSRFVNMSSYGAEYRSMSLKDLLSDAVSVPDEPESPDVLSLTGYLQMTILHARMHGVSEDVYRESFLKIFDKVLSCQNSDGGFGWYEGMKSSPLITAVVLERIASMRDLNSRIPEGLGENIAEAVGYLDGRQFCDRMKPDWSGRLSLEQYLSVRTRYFEVPFTVPMNRNDFREFRKEMKAYLFPVKKRGLDSQILAKARRVRILMNLSIDSSGNLIKAWKLDGYSARRRLSSINDDLSSLVQYAVRHPSGGWYYPNAVLPFRGLIESELYAHAYLCNLFRDASGLIAGNIISGRNALRKNDDLGRELRQIADGIRLWIMVQKETQHWESDPAFSEAAVSVLDASAGVLETKIVSLSGKYVRPFGEIRASGNGLSIEKKYFRLSRGEGGIVRRELEEGDLLSVGDKLVAEYTVHSDENRSFVRVSVPHAASLYPAAPLSGFVSGFQRPAASGTYLFFPQCYRNVKPEASEYMFDILPEEKTVIEEEFHVVQAGVFAEPVVEVECLYSEHYRANGNSRYPVESGN